MNRFLFYLITKKIFLGRILLNKQEKEIITVCRMSMSIFVPLSIKSNIIDGSFVFLSAKICLKLIEDYRDTINNRCPCRFLCHRLCFPVCEKGRESKMTKDKQIMLIQKKKTRRIC